MLVHALVISRLDSANSLLFGLPASAIAPLQRVQNFSAKLIFNARKFDHVTHFLKTLHWLPVHSRIVFKLCSITYKCLNGLAPAYLTELIQTYQPPRRLRSGEDGFFLSVPRSHTKTFGDRAFSIAAPTLWNALPRPIRTASTLASFKSQLKTKLFCDAF